MFSSSGLFSDVPCPKKGTCTRVRCPFSHAPNAKHSVLPRIPVFASVAGPSKVSTVNNAARPVKSSPNGPSRISNVIPSKRSGSSSVKSYASTSSAASPQEPPKKVQKLVGTSSTTTPSASLKTTGVPVLRINAFKSQVAIPVRQTMIKTLYECFSELYSDILADNPTLASEHALEQEQEVYEKSTKLTYRNAVISCVATLKKRPKPDSLVHESVGTEGTLRQRRENYDRLRAMKLATKDLLPHVMSIETLKQWGFMTEIPDGPGSSNPSDEGKIKQCERCSKQFVVKKKEEADECVHHWGRALMTRTNGEKLKVWSCCSQAAADSDGCSRGPHIFYESSPDDLHARHAFTFTRSPLEDPDTLDTALDVVCMDCEMIYTTGGVRVARVSVIDGSAREIFDEMVRMDDGVEVIDFNTRFSGITEDEYKEKAILPLKSIRRALDAYINSDTIIVGHALDNDLKTLRMVHLRCVDTVVLFPHRAGPPYRRALRELSRELLGRAIQMGGGTSGHSSIEDSIATLDLVRYFILNNQGSKKPAESKSSSDRSSVSKVTA